MKKLAAFIFVILTNVPAFAETPSAPEITGWSGAVGVGPIIFPRYSGSNATKTWLIPLISAAYKDILYIEPLRAGAYFWGSADRKMGLGFAVEPRFGFKRGDGSKLEGMATRRNSFEGGPAFDWDLGIVTLSASLFTDLTNSSHGRSGRLYAYRELVKNETWRIGAFVGADWVSQQVADYFFGVSDAEACSTRSAFRAHSTTNVTGGFDGSYRVSNNYSLLLGLQSTYLGSGVAHSPIVESRQSNIGWLGIAWNL